MQQTTWNELSF